MLALNRHSCFYSRDPGPRHHLRREAQAGKIVLLGRVVHLDVKQLLYERSGVHERKLQYLSLNFREQNLAEE